MFIVRRVSENVSGALWCQWPAQCWVMERVRSDVIWCQPEGQTGELCEALMRHRTQQKSSERFKIRLNTQCFIWGEIGDYETVKCYWTVIIRPWQREREIGGKLAYLCPHLASAPWVVIMRWQGLGGGVGTDTGLRPRKGHPWWALFQNLCIMTWDKNKICW